MESKSSFFFYLSMYFSDMKVKDDRVILDKTVGDQVSLWKSSRGFTDNLVTDHACSGEMCTYHHIGNVFVCEKTGYVHGRKHQCNYGNYFMCLNALLSTYP